MCAGTGSPPRLSGAEAEQVAAELLEAGGHRILERNFNSPVGELDLITTGRRHPLLRGGQGALRLRDTAAGRRPWTAENADASCEAAEAFLCQPEHSGPPAAAKPCRFDVVTATWSDDEGAWTFTHYPDAFTLDDAGRRSWL